MKPGIPTADDHEEIHLPILRVACAVPRHAVAAPVDFVRDVRPIFQKHCYECHGEKKQKSGLRLDVKAAALKGGDEHAPNIIAGQGQGESADPVRDERATRTSGCRRRASGCRRRRSRR